MKLFLSSIILALLVACAGTPTATLNDKEAIAIRAATGTRETATALLSAGKISLAKDREIQAQATAIVNGIRAARAANDAAAIDKGKTDAEALTSAVKQGAAK